MLTLSLAISQGNSHTEPSGDTYRVFVAGLCLRAERGVQLASLTGGEGQTEKICAGAPWRALLHRLHEHTVMPRDFKNYA